MGRLHHLADKEAEYFRVGGVLRDLGRVGGERGVDRGFDRAGVGDLAQAAAFDLDIVGVLDLPNNVMARPGMFEKVIEYTRMAWENYKSEGLNPTGEGFKQQADRLYEALTHYTP